MNLWWNKSAADDFHHYNVYTSKSELVDVTGLAPVAQAASLATTSYQVAGLDNGTRYYFALTAVDNSGNESKRVASVAATPAPMPRGRVDPELLVDVYQPDLAWPGTTLLPDNYSLSGPRIIEVNLLGEIVWEYVVPDDLKPYSNPGFDVELLPNNHILFLRPLKGVYEIDRSGKIVWSYLDNKVSHDADRLPNGNTLVVWGGGDSLTDAQVKEVNPQGQVVWAWYAKDYFNQPPYKDISYQGWTHTNAVTRMPNGNTLISLRNFFFLAEVDPQGAVIRTIGEGILTHPHDPEVLPSGNILIANQRVPHHAIEIDPRSGTAVWRSPPFPPETWPVRDANRLRNGNTLITGTSAIAEVTPEGKIVWRLKLRNAAFRPGDQAAAGLGFYKAERISAP